MTPIGFVLHCHPNQFVAAPVGDTYAVHSAAVLRGEYNAHRARVARRCRDLKSSEALQWGDHTIVHHRQSPS